MHTIDFAGSYLRFRIDRQAQAAITVTHAMPTTVNNVRINIECRCELIDLRTSRSHVYVLSASCKTERVGADRDCWLEPNADFCLAISNEEFLTFKSWARQGLPVARHPEAAGVPMERQSGLCCEAWTDHTFQLHRARGRSLNSIEMIIDAIRGDRPLVSHTEYQNGDYRVVIDHPIKTINYSEREGVFQTDTGPILLPDLSPERLARCERLIECFDLAYSAFNSTGWAEFIINVPTPVTDDISVNHYSRPRRIEPVQNMLIEVLDETRHPLQRAAGGMVRADRAEVPS